MSLLLAYALGACGDPDKYFRHAQGGVAGIAVMTGEGGVTGSGGAEATGTAGTSATGAAGEPGSGVAGSTSVAGTTGTAGTTGSGAAGSTSTGAAGQPSTGAAGATGAAGTSGAAGSTTGTGAAGASGTGAAGASGTGVAGASGAGTCAGCKVEIMYTCLSGASDSASFILNATNMGTSLFLLKDLTLRYWYTMDAGKPQELDCDTAHLTCAYIISSMSPAPAMPAFVPVTPPRTGANEYVEIAFTQSAIDVGGQTGPMQLRLHNKDYSPINQADDYSADCGSTGNAHDTGKVTAYLKGVLVGGTEPH